MAAVRRGSSPELGTDPSDPEGLETRVLEASTQSTAARSVAAAEPGPRLGRYLPIEELGRGGMGVVLRAYDSKLQREVALKVLAADGIDRRARARMVREARTMARLNHPHVVAVYDVDDDPRYGVTLAMELVKGCTLSQWLREHPRRWDEVLKAFVEAGRGLSAAHGEGLLHRDFKPANVLVPLDEREGTRGPVKVTDFGLAKDSRDELGTDGGGETSTDPPRAPIAGDVLTEAGTVMGTPAYMAPEQHRGHPLTDAADQYAFCVSLWEALYGERPFHGRSREELVDDVLGGKPRLPSKGRVVPGWLRHACERGLSVQPEQRWPSMNALLATLAQGRTRARVRKGLVAVGVLGALGVGGEGLRRQGVAQRVAACERTGDEVELAFGQAQQQALHEALLATGASHAATTSEKLMPWLQRQAAAWREARVETCLDAEVRGRWTQELHERSLWCLDERRTELQSLVEELTRADVDVLHAAVPAAAGLASVIPCRDSSTLQQLGLPPAVDREAVRLVRADVARAANLERAGRYAQGLTLARTALERAEALQWRPLSAAARARLGHLLGQTGDYAEAEAALEDAYFEAAQGVAPEVAVDAATELVYVLGEKLARHAEAQRWGRHAELALAVAQDRESLGRARLLRGLSAVRYNAGDHDEAARLGEQALALREQALGPEHPEIATSLNNLAGVYWATGAYDDAKALAERALALRERTLGPEHPHVAMSLDGLASLHRVRGEHAQAKVLYARAIAIAENTLGPEHPDVAMSLGNLAAAYSETGDQAQAKALFERALALGEKALPPTHPFVAVTLSNLASVHTLMGSHQEARGLLERALAIMEQTLGPTHPRVAVTLGNLAETHRVAGDLERAKALLERAVALGEEALGPDHPDLATSLHNLAVVQQHRGALDEARARFERALGIRERSLGAEHALVADTLVGLAEVALAQGRRTDALESATRALALRERGGPPADRLAQARFVLARSLWRAGAEGAPDRVRAVTLATQARDGLRDHGHADELAAVERWLTDHAAAP